MKNQNNPFTKVLLVLGGLLILACLGMLIPDFHIAAFILQLYIPFLLIVGAVVVVAWIITFLAQHNMFKGKRLIGMLLVIAILVGTCAWVTVSKNRKREEALANYPDVVFSGVKEITRKDKKLVTGRWDSSTNTYEKVSESDYDDEPDIPFERINPDTGERVYGARVFYNKDKTAAYYTDGSKIIRYTPTEDEYKVVGKFNYINNMVISSMVFTKDGKNAYFIGTTFNNGKRQNDLYYLNFALVRPSVISLHSKDYYDIALAPDENSIFYIGDGKLMQYDIASEKRTTLLEDANPDLVGRQGQYRLRVSEDGRFIMYYSRNFLKNSRIYAFDTQTATTEKIINTNMCQISEAEWAEK